MQRATRVPISGVHSPVYHVNDTSSTLDLAAALLADTTTATPHLTTIIADRQSAGRGRLGRTWTTPDGQALLASTIVSLPTSFPTEMLGWLVHACALSVRDALSLRLSSLGHTVSLKWPNDVLVDGTRKICGILAQLAPASSPFTTSAILGYGINIAQDCDHLATPQATSLYVEGDTEAGTDPISVSTPCLPRSSPDSTLASEASSPTEMRATAGWLTRLRTHYRSWERELRWRSRRIRMGILRWKALPWGSARPAPSSWLRTMGALTTLAPGMSWLPEFL